MRKKRAGFTLIELLLVIAIISILVMRITTAINPSKQLADTRNAQRRMDVQTVLNTVHQYAVDHNLYPADIPALTPKEICIKNAPSCVNGVDLDILIGLYAVDIPSDPKATGTGTLYTIVQEENGRITVDSLGAERGETIRISR
ncbi:hypothetical protein COU80_01365 [Candidatus Peregrinibacteria bacterium CG10_big_fil_rev_8_21_14_0_10_55_24]|nr:MAG: hypothetical protein COU80_01365 [Candidatus Peregrinibacteria bacterium CG10_big_fil_rev_8_21_14_0_10_55_24]